MADTLLELGLTAVIGVIFLGLLLLVLREFSAFAGDRYWYARLYGEIRKRADRIWGSGLNLPVSCVVIAAAYTTGALLEDTARTFFDQYSFLLSSEDRLRTDVYFQPRQFLKPQFVRKYEHHGDLLDLAFRGNPDAAYLRSIHRDVALETRPESEVFRYEDQKRIALAVYYQVRHLRDQLDRQELDGIQERFRFVRGLAYGSVVAFVLSLVLFAGFSALTRKWLIAGLTGVGVLLLPFLEPMLTSWRHGKDCACAERLTTLLEFFIGLGCLVTAILALSAINELRKHRTVREGCWRLVGLMTGIGVLFVLSQHSFEAEVRAHARRVFGYGIPAVDSSSDTVPSESRGSVLRYPGLGILFAKPEPNGIQDAIEDARIAERKELKPHLLQSIKEGSNPVVVTWKGWPGCDLQDQFETKERRPFQYTFSKPMWVVLRMQMDAFLKSEFENQKPPPSTDQRIARMEKRLGLRPAEEKSHFVVMQVSARDLFRPAPNPDITHPRVGLFIPDDFLKNRTPDRREWFRTWFTETCDHSYRVNGYPWTRLGYTYDWGSEDHVGFSEFVTFKDTEVTIQNVVPTNEFLGGGLEDTDKDCEASKPGPPAESSPAAR